MKSALRIYKKTPGVTAMGGSAPPITETPYYERLLKLIPAEIVTLYVTGTGAIPKEDKLTLWIWPGICLLLLLALRAKATQDPAVGFASTQWIAVAISAVSFIIWIYALGGIFETLPYYKVYVASLIIMVWTLAVPFFYKGD